MPKTMSVIRQALGLYNQPNQANLPEGALVVATNVSIDRDGVISKRTGFARYGVALGDDVKDIFEFDGDLIARSDDDVMQYDSDGTGTWSTWTGTYARTETGRMLRSVEMNGTLLFTTSNGIYRTGDITHDPVRAGIPNALTPTIAKSGTGGGWFTHDPGADDSNTGTAVAYRVVWGRSDEHENILLGAPSFKEALTNTVTDSLAFTSADAGGGDFDVTVTHATHGFTTGDVISVSNGTSALVDGDQTITVNDAGEYEFTVTGDPSTGTISVGKDFDVTLTIPLPDEIVEGDYYEVYRTKLTASYATLPGDRLYRIFRGGVNATDISNGYCTISDIWDDDFLGVELYTNANKEGLTQANTRPPWAQDIAAFKGYTWYANTKKPEYILLQLLDVSGIATGTDTIAWTLGATTRTYTFETATTQGDNEFKTFTTGTDAANVRDTAKELCTVINGDSGNTLLYAYYVSGDFDPPGFIVLEARTPNTASFSLKVNAGTPASAWSPELPTSGTDVSSDPDEGPNRVYRSKFSEPEHVPDLNYEQIGGRSNVIERVIALRDSLILLCTEGVWRVSGEDSTSFVYKQLDPSVRISGSDSAVSLNNAVYCNSNQGVVKITEAGTAIISRPIETDISIALYTSSFAVANESKRQYIVDCLWKGDNGLLVYNYITKAWTFWNKTLTAGYVSSAGIGYWGGADDYVLNDRSNTVTDVTSDDFKDEGVATTIYSYAPSTDDDGNAITIARVSWPNTGFSDLVPAVGWLIDVGGSTANVTAVNAYNTLYIDMTLDTTFAYTGACTLYVGIPSVVGWAPEYIDNVAIMKHFQYVQVYTEPSGTANTYTLAFNSDGKASRTTTAPFTATTAYTYGPGVLRSIVPRPHQMCRALSLTLLHNNAEEEFHIANVGFTARTIGDRTTKTRSL